ncbi:MAG: transglutaminase-like domain-containing protein [Thermodesulfobacteriota bacterium]
MNRQEYYFGIPFLLLVFCILTALACAPAKVRVYPRETPPEKTIPPKTSSERAAQEKAAPERTPEIPTMKPAPEKTYDETVSEWESYQDVVKWMENDFSFDKERFEKFKGTLPIPRTPQETFRLKSGIYIDAAMFSKEALNRVNPSYKAQIVILVIRPYGFNHYVCSFRKEGKLFIMDYGTPYKEVTGIHGPYSSLEEYKKFYEKNHPMKGEIEAITYLP